MTKRSERDVVIDGRAPPQLGGRHYCLILIASELSRPESMQVWQQPLAVHGALVAPEPVTVADLLVSVDGSDQLINLLLGDLLDCREGAGEHVAAVKDRAPAQRLDVRAEHALVPH